MADFTNVTLFNNTLVQPSSAEVGKTDIEFKQQEWDGFSSQIKKADSGQVTMSDLLALFAQIIESSQKLRSQVMQNRINEAVATTDLAIQMADTKCGDAQLKFGITLAASVTSMALSSAATIRMGQTKTLKDKHVVDMTSGKSTSVKSLDEKTVNDFSSRLQESRTGKYRAVSQMSDTANGMAGNMNEMQHAAQVRDQEQTQAIKSVKEKFDAMLDQYIQDLTKEAVKLNEILGSVTQASLATHR